MTGLRRTIPPLNVGLVGLGKWGRRYIDVLASKSGVILTCASNLSCVRPEFLPADSDLVDFPRMLTLKLDGIIICSPPACHIPQIIAAGCETPLLVEKPLCFSTSEIEPVSGRSSVLVNHIFLFSNPYEWIKSKVMDDGGISSFMSYGGNKGPFRDYSSLHDYGPHDVAMCLDLFGSLPTDIKCESRNEFDGEVFTIRLGFGDITANIVVGNGMVSRHRRLRLKTKAGSVIDWDDNYSRLTLDGRDISIQTEPPLSRVVDVFLGMMRGVTDDRAGLKLATDVTFVLEECANLLRLFITMVLCHGDE